MSIGALSAFSQVVAAAVGSAASADILRRAIAMGADKGVHVARGETPAPYLRAPCCATDDCVQRLQRGGPARALLALSGGGRCDPAVCTECTRRPS